MPTSIHDDVDSRGDSGLLWAVTALNLKGTYYVDEAKHRDVAAGGGA
jgi:hypothetical protein